MSQEIARKTLKAAQPDEFIKFHDVLRLPTIVSKNGSSWLANESKPLFYFGAIMQAKAKRARFEEPFSIALRSGSDRLFSSTLLLLDPRPALSDEARTRSWLRNISPNFRFKVEEEVAAITLGDEDRDEVTEKAENEVLTNGYWAFAALSRGMDSYLLDEELTMDESPMKEASWARAGVALASLAICRSLVPAMESPIQDPLEALLNPPASDSSEA